MEVPVNPGVYHLSFFEQVMPALYAMRSRRVRGYGHERYGKGSPKVKLPDAHTTATGSTFRATSEVCAYTSAISYKLLLCERW